MPEEENKTIETTQKIILPPSEDGETDQALIDNFLSHSEQEYKQMGEEMEKAEKRREYEKKKSELLQELNDFREWRKEEIDLDESTKNKIIRTVENIPINIDMDNDGSILIEFRLKLTGHDTVLKFLNPNLENDTDDAYVYIYCGYKKYVKLGGMLGDNYNKRGNRKLVGYVLSREKEGLKIPQQEDIEKILNELGEYADLHDKEDQIAMLMYITGMNGEYRLGNGGRINARYSLGCGNRKGGRRFYLRDEEKKYANLCMVSRKIILRF